MSDSYRYNKDRNNVIHSDSVEKHLKKQKKKNKKVRKFKQIRSELRMKPVDENNANR